MSRPLVTSPYSPDQRCPCLSNFYREEFMKCQRCLDEQREFYSEQAVCELERALALVMTQLDDLCANADGEKVVNRLLSEFGTITHLYAWSDPRHVH
jgi:hypothetical protein